MASVVFFTARFQAPVRAWLDQVGRQGPWDGGFAVWLAIAWHESSPFNTPWRREKGGLWDVAPHAISLLWATLGPVVWVTADVGRRRRLRPAAPMRRPVRPRRGRCPRRRPGPDRPPGPALNGSSPSSLQPPVEPADKNPSSRPLHLGLAVGAQGGAVILGGMPFGGMALLLGAGVLAGVVGSAGGIASLLSYPALLAVGLAPKPANVADTIAFVASLPGSALGSRPELRGQGRRILCLVPLAVAGSAAGAALLLITPAAVFGRIVPFLVAFAAVALLVQPRVSAWLERHHGGGGGFWPQCGLGAVWVFDGYWGVGAGVMALAVLALTVETDLARANALKNVLLGVADIACSIVFIVYGPVHWAAVVPVGAGVLAGSRLGPLLARRTPAGVLRLVVALAGLGLAVHLWLSPS